jgi:hypothetical protein
MVALSFLLLNVQNTQLQATIRISSARACSEDAQQRSVVIATMQQTKNTCAFWYLGTNTKRCLELKGQKEK